MKVLIVEDYVDTAEYLRQCIAQWGFEPVVAHTGGAALEQLEKADPDVVLLDLALPDISGWEVAANVHRKGFPMRPLLIVVSAFNPEPEREMPLEVHAHFTKPPDLDGMRQMLDAFSRQLGNTAPPSPAGPS